jgi:carboxyl-terminal processing protease
MKKIVFLLLFILIAGRGFSQNTTDVLSKDHKIDSTKVLVPDEVEKRVNQVITQMLSFYHYKKMAINDSVSSAMFDQYLDVLDNNKLYFLKSDIDGFEKYRNQFDDFLKAGNLDVAFEIFNVYKKRVGERINNITELLKTEFDFTKDESLEIDRDKAEWPKTKEELNELWRLRIKNDALTYILSGKDWKAASESLLKRYHNFHKIILQYEPEDVFSLYINSFTQVYDPHSDYFSPAASDNFNISMKLSLEGIGASLRSDGEYTIVASIIAGGPAYKSGLLKEEDRIIGVAQGNDGEIVDIIGWRLDDAIQLIRGKKGTLVRLQILKSSDGATAAPTEISIVRDEVKLEDQAAKDEIINIEEEGKPFKLGVIKLPSFYTDFEGQRLGKADYKSTTRDVQAIVKKFNNEKVDGVIIDLRNNGGGSLQEAIQLTGLFIKDGPVVQVKSSNNMVEVDKDPDPTILYEGPVAVLVNRFSASASEIFSAAIQDYGRGVIIGANTYGKGTVQNMLDLNRSIPIANRKLGQVKLTIAKFYRINGSTTQRLGVVPDVSLPSLYSAEEFGEASQKSALPWDKIQPTQYNKFDNLTDVIPLLIKKHEERAMNDIEFQLLEDEVKEFNESRDKKTISLNESVRKTEREEADERKKKREEEKAKALGITIKDKNEVTTPESKELDYELKECGRILADLILAKVG